jgi:hypothetical protein
VAGEWDVAEDAEREWVWAALLPRLYHRPRRHRLPPPSSREEEIAGLREMTKELRSQLARVLDQLDRLER